jgi:hypothetical protein
LLAVDAKVDVRLVVKVVVVASVLCLVQNRFLDLVICDCEVCMRATWQLVLLCLVIVVSK